MNTKTLIKFPAKSTNRDQKHLNSKITFWENLKGCGESLAIADSIKSDKRLYVVITRDMQTLLRLEQELRFFLDEACPILQFPDWETLPYDVFSPLAEITSQRLRTLVQLPQTDSGVLITTVATLLQRIAPRRHVLANSFVMKCGDRFHMRQMREQLESVGYQCVSSVIQHGEFAVRGSILDLFPMAHTQPYRIELFDDQIESIRTFDPETQRSRDKVEDISLLPAREFPLDADSIRHFRHTYQIHFPERVHKNALFQDISNGIHVAGIEYYLPLFTETTDTLFEYLPSKTVLVLHGNIEDAANAFHEEAVNRYQVRKSNIYRPALPVDSLYLAPSSLFEKLTRYDRISISPENIDPAAARHDFSCNDFPLLSIDSKQKQGGVQLIDFLLGTPGRVLLVAETAGHREMMLETLNNKGIQPKVIERWQQFIDGTDELCLVVAPIDQGLWLNDPGVIIITEAQLSGDRVQQRRRRKRSIERDLGSLMRNLEELEIGSPVVHQEHGVGRCLGLQRLNVGGIDAEFLAIEYANQDKLYVPVASLYLVARYSGATEENAPLHKLGGDHWKKAKRKAMERARDVAAELLEIYAKREARQGYGFKTITEDYAAFANSFPFEETPDQENAIVDVIKDMHAQRPMDRVVCGDVGFGKTEVAMRAAFIAAHNGKQVAVLVPTTLLAQQHYQNFRDRFADWPIRIEVLSRFVGKKQIGELANSVSEGNIDILIGTHKILQKDVAFKNLGLVIIDEEHRFGVAQKDHFKKLRSEVDILTLTATPIPRTLNMALGGLRDISIIATPPQNRHAIQTFISQWDDTLIQEAMMREIKRGGQVYFLHNKIETMEKTARELQRLVPNARVELAHGQMPERLLERIMLDFYHQRFNVLLATTIIESGIDVPTANTILINRADKLGLAQLHQLRGRVGRSHHRAYAYLLIPPKSLMTTDAVKRLEAIEASGELGAGFMISSHDMEIRGAGELLGDEQSGQIQEIGFSLYAELLERAVEALKSGQQADVDAPLHAGSEIDLQTPALIPDEYLPDVHARLVAYKRIAGARDQDELDALQIEMVDRFGLLPAQTKNLFAITSIKLAANAIGVAKIEAGSKGGRISFHSSPKVDPIKVIGLIQNRPQIYRMDGPDKIRFTHEFNSTEGKIDFVRKLINELAEAPP